MSAPAAVARLCVTYWGVEGSVYETNDAREAYWPIECLPLDAREGERLCEEAFSPRSPIRFALEAPGATDRVRLRRIGNRH